MCVCVCIFIFLPSQTVIFGSYMIAHGFFNVYAMCVDTLFLCFCKYTLYYIYCTVFCTILVMCLIIINAK